jgi:tetratricopeptide (TPR) repeat protein
VPYYLRWRDSGRLQRIHADHVLAMLYARHLPPHLHDLEKAEEFLRDGYELLHESDDPADKALNRNGLAYVEFRRGHTEQAVALVQEALRHVGDLSPKELLQRATLLFNTGMCQQALQQWGQARETFEELFRIDPLMAEHHLEYCHGLLATNDLRTALHHVEIAIGLNETLAESYSLRGLVLYGYGRLPQAIKDYRRAFDLDQSSSAFAYDLAYCLNEVGRHAEAVAVLNTHVRHVGLAALAPEAFTVWAEALSHTGLSQAGAVLRQACQFYPRHADLAENLALVLAGLEADRPLSRRPLTGAGVEPAA